MQKKINKSEDYKTENPNTKEVRVS